MGAGATVSSDTLMHTRIRTGRFVLLLGLSGLCVSGCLSSQRTPIAPESLRAARVERQAAYEAGRARLVSRLADRVAAGDRTINVLVLSGGGQHGAFGAGFLTGWAARTDDPMPRFDVVTGISTGALIAPFAFLGTPEALATVAQMYRDPELIAPRRDLAGALFRRTGGLFNTERLAETLGSVFDARLVAALEPGFADGRSLVVGTTDLDLGRGRAWDLSREIDTTAAGVDRFDRLLLASSAIPGAFPPVEIDGRVHTDGGIATNLLAIDLQLLQALAAEVRARGVTQPVTVRLFVIVNLFLSPPVATVNAGSFQAVNLRASGLLFALGQQQALTRLWEITEAANAGVDGLSVEMRYAAIPDSWAAEPGAGSLFDAAYMNRLQDYGVARGRSAAAWDLMPPGPFE